MKNELLESYLEDKEKIVINDENGQNVEVDIIYYFTLESTGLDYLVYSDSKEDEAGDVLIQVSEISLNDDEIKLQGITNQEVLEEITEILSDLLKQN